MTTETIEQFLQRGGKIKKVDFSRAYEFKDSFRGEFIDYTKKSKRKKKALVDKQKARDLQFLKAPSLK